MTINCPQCEASLTLKGLKAGSYSPKCPKCGKPFILVLVEEEDGSLAIEQLEAKQPEPKPLPKTVAVPMFPRNQTKPGDQDDSDESVTDEEEDEGTRKPLPKTQAYPMIKKKPPQDDQE